MIPTEVLVLSPCYSTGELCSDIAASQGLTLAELGSLNPGFDCKHLVHKGTTVSVGCMAGCGTYATPEATTTCASIMAGE
jgi:hypothetical protein